MLRDMIDLEMPAVIRADAKSDSSFQPIQLLLPQLSYQTARNVVFHIYTDNIPHSCISDFAQLRALSKAAEDLRMVSG